MSNDNYERGAVRLRGVRRVTGYATRVAYLADEIGEWRVVSTRDVASLGEMLRRAPRDEHGDAYSEWCARTVSRDLTPAERRAMGIAG